MQLTAHVNTAIGEANFLAHLQIDIPTRRLEGWSNELSADIAFAESLLVHTILYP